MRATLHILRESFNVHMESDAQICARLADFARMVLFAGMVNNRFPDNETFFLTNRHNLLKKQNVFRDIKIEDFFRPSDDLKKRCPDDVRLMFLRSLGCIRNETSVPQEVAHLKRPRFGIRHGLCVLKREEKYRNIPQVIATKRELVELRVRHHIEFPDSAAFFDECFHYLDGLKLHPEIKTQYVQRFKTHKRQICEALIAMNFEYLAGLRATDAEHHAYLKYFTLKHGFDKGSGEGNPKMMNYHERTYPDTGEKKVPDPHVKFNTDDDNAHEIARIYFATPRDGDRVLYITHILRHLIDRGVLL